MSVPRQPLLRTERLVLSPPVTTDIAAITRACQDPEIPRWTPLPSPYTEEDAAWFIADADKRMRADQGFEWAIRANGTLIGMISLSRRGPGAAEIGYWTAPAARGQGFLGEAARAIIDHAFEPLGLGLDRIEWNAAVGNVASARVARALGFRFEGIRRSAFATPRGRVDSWSAARIFSDDAAPVAWAVLDEPAR